MDEGIAKLVLGFHLCAKQRPWPCQGVCFWQLLTLGQCSERLRLADGWPFEVLCESLAAEIILEAAMLDRGCDADRIRARNRIEHSFSKLKQFRRVATHYDQLARTSCAAVHLVAAFLIARNT